MSRQARRRSDSGYLHLIVRGIGKQLLFEDREDYTFYLSALRRFCGETGVRVLAYCLMENHVHLLVHDSEGAAPQLMKKSASPMRAISTGNMSGADICFRTVTAARRWRTKAIC